MKILYLEDNQMDAELVKRYIASTEHKINIVYTVEEALNRYEEDTDLFLIDLIINNEHVGLEFIRYLRKEGFRAKIVAVTALSSDEVMENCRHAGCDAVLVKPYTISNLAEIVDSY